MSVTDWKRAACEPYGVGAHSWGGICGRPRGYIRKFDMCRLCFRKLALEGALPGVVKSSW